MGIQNKAIRRLALAVAVPGMTAGALAGSVRTDALTRISPAMRRGTMDTLVKGIKDALVVDEIHGSIPDSIEHGRALGHSELEALGVRGGAWTPTLCAVLQGRDSSDPAVRRRVGELRERLRGCLPYAIAHGVRVLAGTDAAGTIADEIALLAGHGLTAGQAIAAAGSAARDFLGIHPESDIVTYDDDPLEDPGVLARPAAVVVRGVRVR